MSVTDKTVVEVPLGGRSYQIHIAAEILPDCGELVRAACPRATRLLVISNQKVAGLYGQVVLASLRAAGFETYEHLIGDGERFKSLATAEKVLSRLITERFERRDAVIALGGGVVGDLAGFVAALYLRGVDYIQIPTTLLAQIDSAVGGKTAVNHRLGKNLIGAFHQPRLVITDPGTLATLPARELTAGLCEAIKYGVIRDRELFEFIATNLTALRNKEADAVTPLIARCCAIKAEVVGADERESGLRQILNFGHTVGHALEAVTHYRRFKHGEAVGYGMIAACEIAARLGRFAPAEADRVAQLVKASGRLPKLRGLSVDEILAAMTHDKKVSQGKLSFILPDNIGDVAITQDVSPAVIRATVEQLVSAA